MKNALIFIGLVALSILYLFEVNYEDISVWNIIAFVIIGLTLIPLVWKMISGIVKEQKEREEKKRLEEAEQRER